MHTSDSHVTLKTQNITIMEDNFQLNENVLCAGFLQVSELVAGIFDSMLSPLLSICNAVLYILILRGKEKRFLLYREVCLAERERGSSGV